jgi:muramoyltetrapeptide carboxypeptidase
MHMPGIKTEPEYLKQGDEVAIISPSFFIEEKKITSAIVVLEQWGLRVRIGKNAFKSSGPFAGSDDERLADLQEMTDSPDIKAILSSRGGYGVSRIINRVNFSALKKYPKWYAGFSDITVLHMWLNKVCGIMTIHGEMPLNFTNPGKRGESLESLRQALFGELQATTWTGPVYRSRDVNAEITGGNLSLLYSLMGTPAAPDTKGTILFIEDVGEYYYHIDRMMTSLKLAGKLDGLAALLVGGMNKIEETKVPWGKNIEDTIIDRTKEFEYPVFFNFPAGHIPDNRAFYLGMRADIKVNDGNFSLGYDR